LASREIIVIKTMPLSQRKHLFKYQRNETRLETYPCKVWKIYVCCIKHIS